MKKHQTRKPKPKNLPLRPAQHQQPKLTAVAKHEHEAKVGILSGTPGDTLDEVAEHKPNKWIPIFISVLAVMLAFAILGSNDAMKNAGQHGLSAANTYNFYQAKRARQVNYQLAVENLQLQEIDKAPAVQEKYEAKIKEYQAEQKRLKTEGSESMDALLVKAEACANARTEALAEHPMFDYAAAFFQIAIVLASASIVAGTRWLLYCSGGLGVFALLLMINGYYPVSGYPEPKTDKLDKYIKEYGKPSFELTCGAP